MGRTACTELQCLYEGDLYLYLFTYAMCFSLNVFQPNFLYILIFPHTCYIPLILP